MVAGAALGNQPGRKVTDKFLAIEAIDGSTIQVRSRFHRMELRRDSVRHFGGSYRHALVRDAGGALRIRLQRVDLFNAQAPFDYVLQIWV